MRDLEQAVADELRRREQQQRAVADLGRLALTGADLRTLFDAAVESVARALEIELASILQLDPETRTLTCRAHVGWSAEKIRPVLLDTPSQIAATFAAADPIVVDDLAVDTRFAASRHLLELGIAGAVTVPIRGDVEPVGVLAAHSREPRTFGPDDVFFMRSVANGLAAAIAREQAEQARHATEDRLRFLAEASEVLAHSLDYRRTIAEVAELTVPRLADWCVVHVQEGDRLEPLALTHADPARVRWAWEANRRFPVALSDRRGPAAVLRTGEPELVEELSGKLLEVVFPDPEERELYRGVGIRSVLNVPLRARSGVVGVLTLVTAESGRRYGPQDLEFATELARRAGTAIENARLHEREQDARREAEAAQARTERLQAVTAALARSRTAAEVYEAIVREGVRAAGASAAVVGTVSSDGAWIELQADIGYSEERLRGWQRFPVEAELPLSDVVRNGEPRFCETLAERDALYPQVAAVGSATAHAFVTLPLAGRSGPIGGVALSYAEEQAFTPVERELLRALGALAGQALERALLHEQADLQRERARFLADASALLAAPVDLEAALQQVADLAVRRIASMLVVDRPVDGGVRAVAFAHADPEKRAEIAAAPEQHEALLQLAPAPGAAVPIVGRDGVLGALLVAGAKGRRAFEEDDLLLADELARRIAVAIETAEARRAAEAAAQRIARLQAVTASLAGARTQAEVAEIAVVEGVAALGAAAGWLSLLDEAGGALELAAATGAYPAEMLSRYARMPLDAPLPGAEVVREGGSRWFGSAGELAAAYPAAAESFPERPFGALAVVSVASGGAHGFLALEFASERALDDDERRLLETVAEQCGQALERARLYDEREARANAAFVLEHVADGVVQVDDRGTIRFWNDAAERITGIRASDAADRAIEEVLAGWSAGMARAARPDSAFPVEAAGRELWLSVSAVAYGGGGVYAFRDLTEQHALEETRRDFLATASHELRTPLTAVYGAAQTLRSRETLGAGDHQELLAMITSESERLVRILDDMLLANRLDAGTVTPAAGRCDAGRIARAVVDLAAKRAPAGIALSVDAAEGLPAVRADGDTLHQVLVNLVDNAIKYSPGGGRVRVALSANGGSVRFAVSDEGLGIPASEHERVFEKFYRLDPQLRRGIGGTGLGLYISRGLVERMGGTIAVSSSEGAGSTFVVELPRA